MIYTASKTVHAPKWLDLRSRGIPVCSTWIDEANPGASQDLTNLWLRCVRESSSCRCLIAYMEPGEVLKGAFVEIGCALASGKPVLAIGFPDEMSFLRHPLVEVTLDIESAVVKALEICERAY